MNTKYKIGDISLKQYCLKNNLVYQTITYRIREKCLTPEEAINYIRPKSSPYDRKTQMLRAHRRYLGYSEEELDLSTEELREKAYIKNGSKFYKGHTLSWWARKTGISKGCLYYRVVKQGMSILEAINIPTKNDNIIKYKGKSVYELFDSKTAHRITYRVRYLGWSVENAVKTPPATKEDMKKLLKITKKYLTY